MNFLTTKTLLYASSLSVILPLYAGIISYRKLAREERVFWVFFPVCAVFEWGGWYLSAHAINNMPLFHLYSIVECSFIAYIFYEKYRLGSWKNILLFIVPAFAIFAALWPLVHEGIYKFNAVPRMIESCMLVAFSFFYFIQMIREEVEAPSPVTENFMFWTSLAVLLYFTGNFFLFLFYEKMPGIWILHSVLNIIMNCLFALAFLCRTLFRREGA